MTGHIHIEMKEGNIRTGCHLEHTNKLEAMALMHVMYKCLKFDTADLKLFAKMEDMNVFDYVGTEVQIPVGDLEQISPELADIFKEAFDHESGRF